MFRFKAIEQWPSAPTKNRERSRFDSTYSQTLELLERELKLISAKNVWIEVWLRPEQIKQDGTLYASAKLSQPGVLLSFTGAHGPVKMPCDTFDRWYDNLRAIALSLEALRKVDRYGCAKKGEQYRGWLALPPATISIITPQDAANFFAQYCDLPPHAIWGNLDVAYKQAARKCHPDTGGSQDLFIHLQQALQILQNVKAKY